MAETRREYHFHAPWSREYENLFLKLYNNKECWETINQLGETRQNIRQLWRLFMQESGNEDVLYQTIKRKVYAMRAKEKAGDD